MKRKIAEIYLNTSASSETIEIEWKEDMYFKEQLGVLEWAKAIIFETVKIENALDAYSSKEL